LVARTGNHKQELRRYTQEIQNLTIAYSQMSDEEKNSEFGRKMAEQIQQSKQKAAELTDIITDLKDEVKRMSDDNFNMKAFQQGVGMVRDGLSATVSVMTLFGAEADKMQQVVTKVTAIMTTANAVISVFTALQKESYIRIIANRMSTALLTRAMAGYTAVTGQAAAATGALAIVQKALPVMAIIGALTAVISVLYSYISSSDDAKKAEEERTKAIEEAKKKQDEYNRSIGRSAAQMRVTFEKLTKEY
jgi:preprotein translocase subunit SecG